MEEHRRVTDEKNPTDRVVELLLFAPVGFALSARDLLPQLVERGRQQLSGQVTMARMLGQLAVKQGQVEAEKALERARDQAEAALDQLAADRDAADRDGGTDDGAAPTGGAVEAVGAVETVQSVETLETVGTATDGAATAPTASPKPVPVRGAARTATRPKAMGSQLAIPDYDSLSASQVLPRLSGLTPSELEAVRAHESANRGRKTILNRVAQLQGS